MSGEPSGDRAAAGVIARLGPGRGRAFGLGGPASEAAGLEPCAPCERSAAMGLFDVGRRLGRVARSMVCVRRAIVQRRPRVALLVNYTEFNVQLLSLLRRVGARIVWYAAPQVWAWRAGRARTLAPRIDAMAVVLPFEEALWREHGVETRYVGHPVMEEERLSKGDARERLGLPTLGVPAVAVIPGSRPGEVRRLLPAMLEATAAYPERVVLLSTALDDRARAWARGASARHGARVYDAEGGVSRVIAAFDVALCASGTASLECALAGVPPVVAYRVDALAGLAARALLATKHVALPNVLLGRRAFPELLQRGATAPRMKDALAHVLAHRKDAVRACGDVRDVLGARHEPSRAVADMIARWL